MDDKDSFALIDDPGKSTRVDSSAALAIIAIVLVFLNVSFSPSTGFGFGIGIISALTMGAGALYTLFAVAWDILFLAAILFVLAAAIVRKNDAKQGSRLIIGGLTLCVVIPVLDIVFVFLVQALGFQNFSLMEMMIIYSYGSDVNLIAQFVIYGGALVIFLISVKTRKPKIAVIGLIVIAVFALITFACGLQPFAYSVGGITLFGQTVPRVTTYYISEFVSMACMWAAAAIFMAKEMKTNETGDDN